MLGFRGAPGNTINTPTSYWMPKHCPRVFVEQVDMVSGVGYERATAAGGGPATTSSVASSPILPCWISRDAGPRMRLRSVHPGVTIDEVLEATGFELANPGGRADLASRPTGEMAMIAELDPTAPRYREVPA